MNALKDSFDDFRCPQCGTFDYDVDDEGHFFCLYCGERADFLVEEVAKGDDGFVFEQLTKKLAEKTNALYEERCKFKRLLLAAKKCADPRKLLVFSSIALAVSAVFSIFLISYLCSYSASESPSETVTIICAVFVSLFLIFAGLTSFAFFKNRRARKKYAPLVAYYASKTANIDIKLEAYTKTLSRLTK